MASSYILVKPLTGIGTALKKRQSERNVNHGRYYLIGLASIAVYSLVLLACWGVFRVTGFELIVGDLSLAGPEVLALAIAVAAKGSVLSATKQFEGIGAPSLGNGLKAFFYDFLGVGLVLVGVEYLSMSVVTVFWFGELLAFTFLFFLPFQMWRQALVHGFVQHMRTSLRYTSSQNGVS